MKKVCVVGHFGFGKNLVNGQTIKTKTVSEELEKQLGVDQVEKIDTHGGLLILPIVLIRLVKAFKRCENIVIMPAHNGIRLFVPLCVMFNHLFKRKLHYVVIGGWLSDFLIHHRNLERKLKSFKGIYIETEVMKKTLVESGFNNVFVMANFKNLLVLDSKDLIFSFDEPLKLCTFSRVMKEKGIEEAINAVKMVNDANKRIVYTLDIYGQIEKEQEQWFIDLQQSFPDYICYKGAVSYNESSKYLKNYYALLFPTYYEGEGFAGTLLDALAAGIPVVATDWKYNKEIVVDGKTGYLIKPHSAEEIARVLNYSSDKSLNDLKLSCILEAQKYIPDYAIQPLMIGLRD